MSKMSNRQESWGNSRSYIMMQAELESRNSAQQTNNTSSDEVPAIDLMSRFLEIRHRSTVKLTT